MQKDGSIVLTGTDSLGFFLSSSRELYDRARYIHTTYIPFYEFKHLFPNKNIDELKLKDGDTLIIPVVKDLVYINGEINRPGIYEINQEKDYNSLINLAGGFGKLANKGLVQGYFVKDDKVFIESVNGVDKTRKDLFRIDVNKIDKLIRDDRIDEVLDYTDQILLIEGLGLTKYDVETLRNIWIKLSERRIGRKEKRGWS